MWKKLQIADATLRIISFYFSIIRQIVDLKDSMRIDVIHIIPS